MKIVIIVAHDKNRVIGKNNQLPWYLPEDLKYFKKNTTGSPIIMGRKTFESIGKPLPNRENIVLTRDTNYFVDGCKIVHSIEDLTTKSIRSDVGFVIGGAEIFKQFIPFADVLLITRIDHEFEGDTFFPELSDEWKLVGSTKGIKDEKNPYDYYFEEYRKSK